MIFGDCPNCDGPVCNSFHEAGYMERIICEHCDKIYWLKHSRLDPKAYTQSQFDERFTLDEPTKTIKPRPAAA